MKYLIVTVFVFLMVTSIMGADSRYIVIESPKANMVEKTYTRLLKVREFQDKIAPGVPLLRPTSMTMDKAGNLFLYDQFQAKIIQLDRSFKFVRSWGGVGQGPGDFAGSGRGYAVFLEIGLDGRLYAHDPRLHRVQVFSTQGKYIGQIKPPPKFWNSIMRPAVDSKGNLILQIFQEGKLEFFTHKEKTVFTLPHPVEKKEWLFAPPLTRFGGGMAAEGDLPFKEPFSYDAPELKMAYSSTGDLLLYFVPSSTFYRVKNGKVLKKKKIWPENAIEISKAATKKSNAGGFGIFGAMFPDRDGPGFFLLHHDRDKKGRRLLYRFDPDGELKQTFYIPAKEIEGIPLFSLKRNNYFFARWGEALVIYKEESDDKKNL